jgi:hypothetical protein
MNLKLSIRYVPLIGAGTLSAIVNTRSEYPVRNTAAMSPSFNVNWMVFQIPVAMPVRPTQPR